MLTGPSKVDVAWLPHLLPLAGFKDLLSGQVLHWSVASTSSGSLRRSAVMPVSA